MRLGSRVVRADIGGHDDRKHCENGNEIGPVPAEMLLSQRDVRFPRRLQTSRAFVSRPWQMLGPAPLPTPHELQFGETGVLRIGVNGESTGEPPGGAPTDAPIPASAAVEVPSPASAIEEVPSGLTTPASSPKPRV